MKDYSHIIQLDPSAAAGRLRLIASASPIAAPCETGNPVAQAEAGSTGIFGATSVESYRAAGALSNAHRDAGGFLDAVDRYAAPDFWRRDMAVKSWTYARQASGAPLGGDLDTVRAFYHAGHGSMADDGSYQVPMGALWSGTDACLGGRDMRFGGDALRYLFWSSSESLRVDGGHDPIRSWALANHGMRMMFGFSSISWDSPQQGANFWRHWRTGKSMSQAWLDAGWDVAHDQAPSVCAVGATPDEAARRLFGERMLEAPRADDAWWMWRWIAPVASLQRMPLTEAPERFSTARLVHAANDRTGLDAVLTRLGIDPKDAMPDASGTIDLRHSGMRVLAQPSGRILIEFGQSARGSDARVPLQRRALVGRARSALRRMGFANDDTELVFDRIAVGMSGGGRRANPQDRLPDTVDEIIVQFRQMIDGTPVISPDAGYVRVTMSNNCALLRIESSLRRVAELRPQSFSGAAEPVPPGPARNAPLAAGRDIGLALAQQSARLMRDLAARGAAPLTLSVLPGETEIGYRIRSNSARLVARQGIEIRCVRGFRKRYWIQSDLGD